MLEGLSRLLFRRRLPVLAATLAAVALAGVVGGGAAAKLKPGGFDDPAQSTRAAVTLRDTFHSGDPNLVLLVTAHHGTVDNPAVAAWARALGGAWQPSATSATSPPGGRCTPPRCAAATAARR